MERHLYHILPISARTGWEMAEHETISGLLGCANKRAFEQSRGNIRSA